MRFLIISSIFPPEPVVSARTSAQIAEELARAGHEVVVITAFPSRPSGKRYEGYSRKLYKTESSPAGYRTIRCFTLFSPHSTLLSRFMENISFGITGGLAFAFMKKPDALYANAWPIFSSFVFYGISRLRGTPSVVSIQDLYPESLTTQDRIKKDGSVYRLFLWVDGLIARGSDGLVVISDHFAEAYRRLRNVSDEKIHVVPNWADVEEIHLDAPADEFRERLGIPRDAFVLVYGGNIGAASGIDTLLDAFKLGASNDKVYLIIAGEGSRLADCQEAAGNIPGERVVIHSPWHERETSLVLRSADLLLLPTKNEQSLASIPSKLIYYMLAARPILALVHPDSETARMINQARCGWVLHTDQPAEIMGKITWIKNHSSWQLEEFGLSGRDFATKNFSKESCLPKITALMQNIAMANIRR